MLKTPSKPLSRARLTRYACGQHDIICRALGVSPDPSAPGPTAYEAVCVLMDKLGVAANALGEVKTKTKGVHEAIAYIERPQEDFAVIQCR